MATNAELSHSISYLITCCAKLLESDWLGAIQLNRKYIGEMHAKLVIVI